ncbi:hypothetical protein [Lunatibacter salilacus]|uniref:hypothetical protein n=1 Tax=Lunatibacter salilacus TaxID=2483804 RepID=UPI001F23DAE1|nr:hypothetical protein [Lunatibacter salilacus]
MKLFEKHLTPEFFQGLDAFFIYSSVVGWTFENVNQGYYNDNNIINPKTQKVEGICIKKGENSGLPTQWLNYAYQFKFTCAKIAYAFRGIEGSSIKQLNSRINFITL